MLSAPINIGSVHEGFSDALRWHLAPFARPGLEHRSFSISVSETGDEYEGGEALLGYGRNRMNLFRGTPAGVLRYALWDIHRFVPPWSRDFLCLHAAGVVRERQAVLLPATRDIGKSSLAAALLLEGFNYLSDEVGAIDPITRRAYPFPKHIGLDPQTLTLLGTIEQRLHDREGLNSRLEQRYLRPEDVGSRIGDPAPIRWVVFPSSRRKGRARLIPIARAEAVKRMADACFNMFRFGERGVVLLSQVAEHADAFLLEGGDPSERAALLAQHLDRGRA